MFKLLYPKFWQQRSLLAYFILPLSLFFMALTDLRKIFARPIKLNAFTVIVGNTTVGGTGKTPMIKFIASYLAVQNISFVIICKAINTSNTLKEAFFADEQFLNPDICGDEAVELSKVGKVIVTPNIHAAQKLLVCSSLNPKIILIDDGLQNPNIIKDFSILMIDQQRLLGNGFILPAGPLRESFASSLSKSSAIVLLGVSEGFELPNFLLKESVQVPIFKAHFKCNNLSDTDKILKYHAFCAIGNPDKFFNYLEKNNLNITDKISFPDHHSYSLHEILNLYEKANSAGAQLITTEKDAVKLKNYINKFNIRIVKVSVQLDDQDAFLKLLENKIAENI